MCGKKRSAPIFCTHISCKDDFFVEAKIGAIYDPNFSSPDRVDNIAYKVDNMG